MARWVGMLMLGALALLTAHLNVRATVRSYRVGEYVRTTESLRHLTAFRRSECTRLLATESLSTWARENGLRPEELGAATSPLPSPDGRAGTRSRLPLARGEP